MLASRGNGAGVWVIFCGVTGGDAVSVMAGGTAREKIMGDDAGAIGSIVMAAVIGDCCGGMVNNVGRAEGVTERTETCEGPGPVKAMNSVSGGVLAALARRPNSDQVIDSWML